MVNQVDYSTFLITDTDASEVNRPMWNKMFQRAGLDPQKVQFAAQSELARKIQSNPSITNLFTLGESSLMANVGEDDLFRWFGRKVKSTRYGRLLQLVPLQKPSLLLPRWGDEDEPKTQLEFRPARFQGLWVRHFQHGLSRWTEPPSTSYLVDPPKSVWDDWVEQCLKSGDPVSTDIETAYKMKIESEEDYEEEELQTGAMLRISFAYRPHHAISVFWGQPYLDGIRRILAECRESIWWNGILFDIPRLKKEGFPALSRAYDYQDGWHMLQSDLPRGLEFVSAVYTRQLPWKHLNASSPGLYSCIDADIALQNAIGIRHDLQSNNQWETFLTDSVELMPILVRAGERGNKIDVEYSQALKEEMLQEKERIVTTAASMAPIEVRPRKRYKRVPDIVAESIGSGIPTTYIQAGDRTFEPIHTTAYGKICSVCRQAVGNYAEHLKGGKKNPCKVAGGKSEKAIIPVVEWDEILPFNLGSPDQIKDYIRFYKLPMGQDRKTKKDSANAKHITKLAAKWGDVHPIFHQKLKEAKLSKVLGTYVYCDRMDEQQLIHSTYLNSPSTWRLAARNENLTNVGKRQGNPWAVRARRQIVAREGHIFVQADSTSIEAVVTGWLIGDENFIHIAKKSIHAYLVCADQGLEFNDSNIELVKAKYKNLYNQFKTAVYLLLYGGDPYLMFMENPEQFPTVDSARAIQDKIFSLLPALKQWQDDTRIRAKKDGYLQGPWGHRHYFYDVHTFYKNKEGKFVYNDDGTPRLKLGQDAKKALAFMPQHIAAKFGRDSLRLIGNHPYWSAYMPANVFVHDGYTLEVPVADASKAADYLVEVLTRPVPELNNLRIGCEVDMGYNWADSEEGKPEKDSVFADRNPNGMKTIKKVEV